MKKIYSIVLMAAALLVGTNVNAATPIANFAALQTAFGNETDGGDLVLTADFAMTSTIVIQNGKKYTLDLGGHTLTGTMAKVWSYQPMFFIVHGELELVGKGELKSQTASGSVIELAGAGYELDGDGNAQEGQKMNDPLLYANWSVLTIGNSNDSIKLTAAGATSAGIEVYAIGKGRITFAQAGISSEYIKYNSSIVNSKGKGIDAKTAAYGVVITVNDKAKVRGEKYGIQISGIIGTDDKNNQPIININKGAEIESHPTESKSTAVYAAGTGAWNISGTVHGSTGVYVKAGTVAIEDAIIYSDNTEHSMITQGGAGRQGSGIAAGGSAVVMESTTNYAGAIHVTISGDSEIRGTGGYAIEAVNSVQSGVQNEVDALVISGGTFEAGATGGIAIQPVIQAVQDNDAEIVVSGGVFDTDIQNVLDVATGNHIVGQTTDDSGKQLYVINPLPDGKSIEPSNTNINGRTDGYITWTDYAQPELTGDVTLDYLEMNGTSTVTVPSGKTLTVGSIVMSAASVITVEGGGTLVITGENGLVANKVSNIKIAAKEGNMGRFILTPKAESNKNPSATVAFEMKARKDGDNYIFQRFGVPAFNGISLSEMTCDVTTSTYAFYWGETQQDWVQITSGSYKMKPFQGLALTNTTTAGGAKYSFPCRLMGNSDASLLLVGKWSSFANSYMADVDLYALLSKALETPGVGATIYLYDAEALAGAGYWFVAPWVDFEEWKAGVGPQPVQTALEPMQGFILNNLETTNTNAAIEYKETVWKPLFGAAPKAALHKANVSNTTRVKITITAENGQFDAITLRQNDDYTAEYENGYDAFKNMNVHPVNIYANTNFGELSAVASNNIDGIMLNIATKEETMFKMTFSNLAGEQLAIRDNLTGSIINMVEGAEYFFSVAENSNSERFQIIGVKNAPTDVENVAVSEGAKAVYTVLGQYMGTTDNWNTLPTGMYVVDGVKMVK